LARKTRLIVLAAFLFSSSAYASVPARSIVVDVSDQKLYLYEGQKLEKTYPVSTSKYGIGNKLNSGKTPLGAHRVKKKIGQGAPAGTIFKNRLDTGKIAAIDRSAAGAPEDVVTSRILWLDGLEPGVNRGKRIDSYKRFIYIHGTASEGLIGRPASNGCVRMTNRDVIELFDLVPEGTRVDIRA
jgi:lipoprotein-anchoring transpeptidase ErfK/SrfK